MATQDLLQIGGGAAGRVELDAAVFEVPIREHLFQAEVRRQLARRQSGTHATKNRSAVSGGGSKPWRQKGTGRARQGSTRSPQWKGGGSVFGPVPRSHEHRLPKKVRRGALRAALSLKRREGKLLVVDAFELAAIKTKQAVEALASLGLDGSASVLIVLAERAPNLERSVRNLRWADTIVAGGLNTYDVLRHGHIVMTRSALDQLHTRLGERTIRPSVGSADAALRGEEPGEGQEERPQGSDAS